MEPRESRESGEPWEHRIPEDQHETQDDMKLRITGTQGYEKEYQGNHRKY